MGKTYNVYHLWVYDFLKRNRYSKRKVTQQQKLAPDTLEKIYDFIKERIESWIYYQIDENINLIVNVDETPIWMEFKLKILYLKLAKRSKNKNF